MTLLMLIPWIAATTATAQVDPGICYANAEDPATFSTLACDELLALNDAPIQVQVAVLIARGRILERRGDLAAAEADFTTALGLKSDSYVALTNRGNVRLRRGEPADALRDYDAAAELSSFNDPRVLFNRSFAYRALGNLDAAAADLDRARTFYDSDEEPATPDALEPVGRFEPPGSLSSDVDAFDPSAD